MPNICIAGHWSKVKENLKAASNAWQAYLWQAMDKITRWSSHIFAELNSIHSSSFLSLSFHLPSHIILATLQSKQSYGSRWISHYEGSQGGWVSYLSLSRSFRERVLVTQPTKPKAPSSRTTSDVVARNSKLRSEDRSVRKTSRKDAIFFHLQAPTQMRRLVGVFGIHLWATFTTRFCG